MEIRSEADYKEAFGGEDSKKRCEALKYALDIRKFEIELYWKRAAYFWTLIAASFAGFFALSTTKEPRSSGLILLVSCLGLLLSVGWYLVNRGSKYWQENWERHVDLLESEFIGPLYETTISQEEFSWLRLWTGYPYSVSKINQIISLFIVFIWFGLSIASFIGTPTLGRIRVVAPWILAAGTAIFSICLFTLGLGGSVKRPRNINFTTNAVRDAQKSD